MIQIRTFTADDYPAVATLRSSVASEPVNATVMRENDEATAVAGLLFKRFVAEEAGQVVGYGQAARISWLPEHHFLLYVLVRADRRHQGIGSRLLSTVEDWAREQGAAGEFTAFMRGDDEASYGWACHRGWHMDLQRTESVLDLQGWDGSRFAGHLEQVRAGGFTFLTTAEVESEDLLRQLYEVEAATAVDVPDYEGFMPSWEEWRQEFRADRAPRLFALGLYDGRVVGESILNLPRVAGAGAYTGYTGVLRPYRGRGLALALKLLTIEAAVAAGAPHMRTNNDEINAPMLAVNAKLGYRMVAGPRRMKKQL